MNNRDISTIRRKLTHDKNNITKLCGCYVSSNKEIIAEFSREMVLMSEDESEKYLSLLKKVLTGRQGKNLNDMEFSTQAVIEGEEHKLLEKLRSSSLSDEDAVKELFGKIIASYNQEEGGYLILLAHEVRDLVLKNRSGDDDLESDTQFSYILCAICPVKETKSYLSYSPKENGFRPAATDWAVSSPLIGFMYPELEDNGANIYRTLFYSKDANADNDELITALFNTDKPMPADTMREKFNSALTDALGESCELETVSTINENLCAVIEDYKNDKHNSEPLTMTKTDVKNLLVNSGVSDECVESFGERYSEEFGDTKSVSVMNLIDESKTELHTEEVEIKVTDGRTDLVSTRVIDGVKYVLIRADNGVVFNGVELKINE